MVKYVPAAAAIHRGRINYIGNELRFCYGVNKLIIGIILSKKLKLLYRDEN